MDTSTHVDVLAVLEKHHRRAAFGPRPLESDELAECRAAVRDMLDALRVAYSDIQRLPGHTINTLGRIEAAIAKATGSMS